MATLKAVSARTKKRDPRKRTYSKAPTRKPDSAWFMAQFATAGLSMRGMARELDIDHTSLLHALAGSRHFRVEELIAIAATLRKQLEHPLPEVIARAGFPEVWKVSR